MAREQRFWLVLVFLVTLGIVLPLLTRPETENDPLPISSADDIVVEKSTHTLTLLHDGNVLKSYKVALGRGGRGPKEQEGDNKVPEGKYRIIGRNRRSIYHRALQVGYPTPEQVEDASRRGIDPGGEIMIHGIRNGLGWLGPVHRTMDWTAGCIAVTDGEIEEIWRLVPDGTPIEIEP